MNVYELEIKDIESGTYAISLVADPANESEFMFFSKEHEEHVQFSINEERMEITGVVLVPNQEILRRNTEEGYYKVFASAETIRQSCIRFSENNFLKNTTLGHQDQINDTVFFENWLIVDINNDKANAIGLKNLVAGSWVSTLKVNNRKTWEDVKNSNVAGFSIEGLYSKKLVEKKLELSKIEEPKKLENIIPKINKKNNIDMSLFTKLKTLLSEVENENVEKVEFVDVKLEDDTLIRIDDATLTVSKINEDGTLTQMEDGTYILESGETLLIIDGKKSIEAVKPDEIMKTEIQQSKIDFEIVELKKIVSEFENEKIKFESEKNDLNFKIVELEGKIVELEKQPMIEKTPIFTEISKKDLSKAEMVLNNLKKFRENNK